MRRIYQIRDDSSLPKKAKSKLLTPRTKSSQRVTKILAQKTKGRRDSKFIMGLLDEDLKEYLGFKTKNKPDYIDVPSKEVSKTVIPQPSPQNSPKVSSQTPLLQAKKLSLGKLGLGAVGLAVTGAIGYGLYRKVRKDKGKKRGRYMK